MRITKEEQKFMTKFYDEVSKLDLNVPKDKEKMNKLLAEEEAIEASTREHHETPHFRSGDGD